MKVLCIHDCGQGNVLANEFKVKEGEVYEPIAHVNVLPNGEKGDYYLLFQGRDNDYYYSTWRFAPLSSIDETTFERNYNKETV